MFQMAHGSDYRVHLPNIPVLPELTDEARSAWVIVVRGPVTIPHMGPVGAAPAAATSIVCVIINDVPTVWDAKVDRLRMIKGRYDPDNLFRINHNIPPAP